MYIVALELWTKEPNTLFTGKSKANWALTKNIEIIADCVAIINGLITTIYISFQFFEFRLFNQNCLQIWLVQSYTNMVKKKK